MRRVLVLVALLGLVAYPAMGATSSAQLPEEEMVLVPAGEFTR